MGNGQHSDTLGRLFTVSYSVSKCGFLFRELAGPLGLTLRRGAWYAFVLY